MAAAPTPSSQHSLLAYSPSISEYTAVDADEAAFEVPPEEADDAAALMGGGLASASTVSSLGAGLPRSQSALDALRHAALPVRKIIAFGCGHVLNDLCASCWFTYLLVLMHKVLGFAAWKSALILLSGQIADALATPLVGIYSDKSRGMHCCGFFFGRRHLWYTIGTFLVFVNFFFLFAICAPCEMVHDETDTNNTANLVYYCLSAALFNVGWASVQVSHMSLVPELTSDTPTRVLLNSVRYSATVGSNLLVFLVLALVIQVWALSPPAQFHTLAYVSLGVGLITSVIFLIGTEEPRPEEQEHTGRPSQQQQPQSQSQPQTSQGRRKTVDNGRSYQALSDGGGDGAGGAVVGSFDISIDERYNGGGAAGHASVAPVVPGGALQTTGTVVVSSSNSYTKTTLPLGISPKPAADGSRAAVAHSKDKGDAAFVPAGTSASSHRDMMVHIASSMDSKPASAAAAAATADESPNSPESTGPRGVSLMPSLAATALHGDANDAFESTLAAQLYTLPIHFKSYRCWLRQPEFYVCACIYMCARLVVNVSQVFLPFFILDALQLSSVYITILPCVLYVSSLAAATAMSRLNRRLGRKSVFLLGFLSTALGLAAMIFLPAIDSAEGRWAYAIYPCCILVGLGNGSIMVCCSQLTSDLIGSRTNYAAFVFGSFSFTDKLSNGIALSLLQAFNDDSADYTRWALTLPPIAAALCGCVLVLTKVDLAEWKRKHHVDPALMHTRNRHTRKNMGDAECGVLESQAKMESTRTRSAAAN